MADKYTMELDDSFIKKLYALNNKLIPENEEITIALLKRQLFDSEIYVRGLEDELTELKDPKNRKKLKAIRKENEIKHREEEKALEAQREFSEGIDEERITNYSPAQSSSLPSAANNKENTYTNPNNNDMPSVVNFSNAPVAHENKFTEERKNSTILIIDDLGIITYQLSILFQKQNFIAVQSKEIYEAINTFKKHTFDFVVMDLFIPTEREGFILLDELKKITVANRTNTIIGVMSASAKKVYKQLCAVKGASFYIEKIDSWQNDLIKTVLSFKNK